MTGEWLKLILSPGVTPDGIIGHSTGEMGCGYADGGITREQTMRLAYHRGTTMMKHKEIKVSRGRRRVLVQLNVSFPGRHGRCRPDMGRSPGSVPRGSRARLPQWRRLRHHLWRRREGAGILRAAEGEGNLRKGEHRPQLDTDLTLPPSHSGRRFVRNTVPFADDGSCQGAHARGDAYCCTGAKSSFVPLDLDIDSGGGLGERTGEHMVGSNR